MFPESRIRDRQNRLSISMSDMRTVNRETAGVSYP